MSGFDSPTSACAYNAYELCMTCWTPLTGIGQFYAHTFWTLLLLILCLANSCAGPTHICGKPHTRCVVCIFSVSLTYVEAIYARLLAKNRNFSLMSKWSFTTNVFSLMQPGSTCFAYLNLIAEIL